MKILLSPAKTLDQDSKLPTQRYTQPKYSQNATLLNEELSRKTQDDLQGLMGISKKLADLNYGRYQQFEPNHTSSNSRPAIYTFAGDVYNGFDAYTLPVDMLDVAQGSVRILSGMYGILKPLDLMQPYRLEMGTKLPVRDKKDLYEFWGDTITNDLNEDSSPDELIVNLASKEYFKAVKVAELKGQLIQPVFKDLKNGQLKIIAIYAKMARGAMARYLVESTASTIEDVKSFTHDGYRYSEKETLNDKEPVFTR